MSTAAYWYCASCHSANQTYMDRCYACGVQASAAGGRQAPAPVSAQMSAQGGAEAPTFQRAPWQGQPIAAPSADSRRDALRVLGNLVLAALVLIRIVSLLLAVGAFASAATQFTSYFGDANRAMGGLCTGLALVAFAYILPRYADARTFITSR